MASRAAGPASAKREAQLCRSYRRRRRRPIRASTTSEAEAGERGREGERAREKEAEGEQIGRHFKRKGRSSRSSRICHKLTLPPLCSSGAQPPARQQPLVVGGSLGSSWPARAHLHCLAPACRPGGSSGPARSPTHPPATRFRRSEPALNWPQLGATAPLGSIQLGHKSNWAQIALARSQVLRCNANGPRWSAEQRGRKEGAAVAAAAKEAEGSRWGDISTFGLTAIGSSVNARELARPTRQRRAQLAISAFSAAAAAAANASTRLAGADRLAGWPGGQESKRASDYSLTASKAAPIVAGRNRISSSRARVKRFPYKSCRLASQPASCSRMKPMKRALSAQLIDGGLPCAATNLLRRRRRRN